MTFFQKGLTHGFGPKIAIFPTFFLGNIGQEKVFYDILERKNDFPGYKKKTLKKWKNWHFSKRVNSSFWSKNAHFSNFYFLCNIGQEKVFYDILERKNAFIGYKNNKFKKWKNWDFCKGAKPWFWFKIGHLSIFFLLGIIGQENVFYDILERENTSLGYKNKKFKKWKNWDLCKGVNPWFWSKIGHFSISCF